MSAVVASFSDYERHTAVCDPLVKAIRDGSITHLEYDPKTAQLIGQQP
jgi:hypothetical protein